MIARSASSYSSYLDLERSAEIVGRVWQLVFLNKGALDERERWNFSDLRGGAAKLKGPTDDCLVISQQKVSCGANIHGSSRAGCRPLGANTFLGLALTTLLKRGLNRSLQESFAWFGRRHSDHALNTKVCTFCPTLLLFYRNVTRR